MDDVVMAHATTHTNTHTHIADDKTITYFRIWKMYMETNRIMQAANASMMLRSHDSL